MVVKKQKLPTKAHRAKIRKKVSEMRDRLDKVYQLSDPARTDDPAGRKELDLHIEALTGEFCQFLCGIHIPQIYALSYTPPKKK